MKEILFYSSVYSYSVSAFITALEQEKGKDVVIRMNTNGGSPEDAYGMIAKMQEHNGNITIKVDGKAYSMGAFLLAYAKDVEALDVSDFLIHRAAYPSWIESSKDWMTDDMWASLKRINTQLRTALEAKIDAAKFEKMKGVTLDSVFSTDTRIDVTLTAQEAKEIGLIDRIVSITPEKKAEIEGCYRIAASHNPEAQMPQIKLAAQSTPPITTKSKNMTLAEFKANHPEVYAQAANEGATQERDRVGAWMAYADVDLEAVTAGINEGKPLAQKTAAELARKVFSKQALADVTADSPKTLPTGEPTKDEEKTAEQAQVDSWKKEVKAGLKW